MGLLSRPYARRYIRLVTGARPRGQRGMTNDLVPGSPFPDLPLSDHSGHERTLGELAAGDPVVLHTYRG